MRRISLLLAFILIIAASAFAQRQVDEYSGTIYVPFGYARQVDGTFKPTKGLFLPFTARRIHALPIKDVKPVEPFGEDLTTVFSADAGAGYGFIEDPDPSSIDDLVMVNGANLPWKELTFGINADSSQMILIRWIVFTNYVTGRGHNVSAFDPYIDSQHQGVADFGGLFNAQSGTWKVTVNVAPAGAASPQNSIFLAQQFRDPGNLQGEGAFLQNMRNVYNSGAPPTVGTSDNVFWYDWDDLNGIYSEDEIDNFGEGTFANHLRVIAVEGTQDTLVPFQFNLAQGTFVSGELVDFWQNDNSYYMARPLFNVPRTTPPLQIEVEALSPAANILSLKFSVEAAGDSSGGSQIIQLFNYQTNTYDTLDTRAISATDTTVDVFVTSQPSRYVHPSNRRMKSKISFFPPANASRTWKARIDQTQWVITR